MRLLPALLLPLTLAFVSPVVAGPGEDAAYRKLASARRVATASQADSECEAFAKKARAFLSAFPRGRRAAEVQRWVRGMRNRVPPPLAVDRWVGPSIDPHEISGEVTAIFFFSLTHPQTANALPAMVQFHARLAGFGLRVVGVASVVDDHANQTPKILEARLKRQRLPFPVAIDRQVKGASSVSYKRYFGASLPWLALIDRYGRLASLQPASATANHRASISRAMNMLLRQPTHQELMRLVANGGPTALDRIEAIRTPQTFAALLHLLARPLPRGLHTRCYGIAEGLAPKGFPIADPREALRRWRTGRYRYSPEHDRLVAE